MPNCDVLAVYDGLRYLLVPQTEHVDGLIHQMIPDRRRWSPLHQDPSTFGVEIGEYPEAYRLGSQLKGRGLSVLEQRRPEHPGGSDRLMVL